MSARLDLQVVLAIKVALVIQDHKVLLVVPDTSVVLDLQEV